MDLDFSQLMPDSDQVLVVEGREFQVHRNVLGLWSPVFRAMFNKDFKESTQRRIELPGKKADMFGKFLMLMYSAYDMNLPKDGWMDDKAEKEFQNIFLILEYIREYQASRALPIMEKKLQEYLSKTTDDLTAKSWVKNNHGYFGSSHYYDSPSGRKEMLQSKLQTYVRLLLLADQFNLEKVASAILPLLKHFRRTSIVAHNKFKLLSLDKKYRLISEMACQLETSLTGIISIITKSSPYCQKCHLKIKDSLNDTLYQTHE